ncbi:MAG: HisA/HisF-related TIM barrel protein [Candidatus Vidania fulgoroideorum]
MIFKRIISCLDVSNNYVVKGRKFKNLYKCGSPLKLAIEYSKNSDEIVYLNINKEKIYKIKEIIKKISKNINIPLIVGGNINTIKDVKLIFENGADKVAFNSTIYYNKKLIKKINKRYGSQAIIASIDVKKINEKWIVYINGGKKNTKINIKDWIKIQNKNGIGEYLITNIDRDGTNKGYDKKLIKKINIDKSIIFSGGGGNINTIKDVFKKTKTNTILLASILHKKKTTIKKIKEKIKNNFFIRK